jgi:hypothetical protein
LTSRHSPTGLLSKRVLTPLWVEGQEPRCTEPSPRLCWPHRPPVHDAIEGIHGLQTDLGRVNIVERESNDRSRPWTPDLPIECRQPSKRPTGYPSRREPNCVSSKRIEPRHSSLNDPIQPIVPLGAGGFPVGPPGRSGSSSGASSVSGSVRGTSNRRSHVAVNRYDPPARRRANNRAITPMAISGIQAGRLRTSRSSSSSFAMESATS